MQEWGEGCRVGAGVQGWGEGCRAGIKGAGVSQGENSLEPGVQRMGPGAGTRGSGVGSRVHGGVRERTGWSHGCRGGVGGSRGR